MSDIKHLRPTLSWFNIFCWPLKCINCFMSQPKNAAHVQQSYVPGEAPPPLPARNHRLSITETSIDPAEPQTTCNQLQSRFFSRLPKEVRLQIYENVLGGRIIYLEIATPDRWGLSYLRRLPWFPGENPYDCHLYNVPRTLPPQNLLQLLKSCRLAYSEAISLLYSANTFSFQQSDCFKYLPTLIPHQRFEAIRSVFLYIYLQDFSSEDSTAKYDYDEIWLILAAMPTLRLLCVTLGMGSVPHISQWQVNEQAWLAPLKTVKGLDMFMVDITSSLHRSPISSDVDVGECHVYV